MPIENEFKYVLTDDEGALRRALRAHPDTSVLKIEQGYLTKGVRIRRTENVRAGVVSWDMNFKRKVGGDVVEIETAISEEDFLRLWPTSEESLEKTRFGLAEGDIHWDIDFFGKSKDPYFIMAEAEMPASRWNAKVAPEPSDVIADYVLHVAGKDHGFSSRRLCSRKYASRLLEDLRLQNEPERRLAFG